MTSTSTAPPGARAGSPHRRGAMFATGAYGIWGLFPLYWPLLEPASAAEILAHRVVWSFVVVVGALAVLRRWGWVRRYGADRRRLGLLAAAGVVLSVNWLVYIYGVNSEQVVETSLGYFINPIVTVLLGVVVLGERMRAVQWVALGLVSVAVVVLTVGYGHLPWIALTLAATFASYGLLKKKADAPAVEGLAVETTVLLLPAAGFLAVLAATGDLTFGSAGAGNAALLAGAGLVTVVPLLLFGAAATKIPLSLLGWLQYLTPTLQLLVGVVVYGEPMPPVRLAGFVLVWLALLLLGVHAAVTRRRATPVDPAEAADSVA